MTILYSNCVEDSEIAMSIDSGLSSDGTVLTITLGNKFDFSKVQEFKESYSAIADTAKNVIVDLKNTQYMDSSALGMLLNMQKTIGKTNIKYEIINCQEQILRILTISRFDKKFIIR